ncbi:phosphonate metabolism protein/1,5-bisphosphokinase (PRPP-forming) PhnN [Burkholderia alba]|uniref:phosphonate metabolism protein/1,5-bisphosphokinase (PRPP-forming) PhnN n=1 Tax=Burkholderia alba TaxID=2683677 RepID=UPI002B05B50F|nr:phosphonate metabolism protein/1,5-bisphosphokinase (PRPP-forming) PhnN [Burkholderia alba]
MSAAPLVYVMGPSGAGKDALLAYARARLRHERIAFAHRYITRTGSDHENHIALNDEEFAARSALGLFALEWTSHALRYGVGIEIDAWLAKGCTVVVNGSRAYLPFALARYPQLRVVHIDAAPHVLAARLATRGRETADQVRARLERKVAWTAPAGAAIASIDNSGALDDAGQALVALLRQSLPESAEQ